MKNTWMIAAMFCLTSIVNGMAQNDSIRTILKQAEQGDAIAQTEVGAWYYSGKNDMVQNYAVALQWWAKAAQQGNVNAIANMGLCYQYGRGIEKDSVRATQLYLRAIEKGNKRLLPERRVYAQKGDNFNCILLGLCHQKGIGTDKNLSEAMKYYEMAAKQSSIDGQRELGLCLLNAKKNSQAAQWFKMAADHNDVVSAYYYGKMLKDGQGVLQDKQQTVIYWLKAAEQGFAQAQCDLGSLYQQGDGVSKDAKQAVCWFTKAAVQGVARAQWNLAVCYMNGEGANRDYEQALYWFGEAVSKGYSRAFKNLCNDAKDNPFLLYLQGVAAYQEEDMENAMKYFKQLDKLDIMEGTVMSGVCFANPRYSKCNPKKAVKILKGIQGSPMAQFRLGIFYEVGEGMAPDVEQALRYYNQAALSGYAPAQCRLGDLYFEGHGVPQNYVEAVRYYRMADVQGRLEQVAAQRYAACYENGWGGLDVDKQKAGTYAKYKQQDSIKKLLDLLH